MLHWIAKIVLRHFRTIEWKSTQQWGEQWFSNSYFSLVETFFVSIFIGYTSFTQEGKISVEKMCMNKVMIIKTYYLWMYMYRRLYMCHCHPSPECMIIVILYIALEVNSLLIVLTKLHTTDCGMLVWIYIMDKKLPKFFRVAR